MLIASRRQDLPCYLVVAFLAVAVAPGAWGQVVVPSEAAAVEGDTHNGFPFHCLPFGPSMRYQQVLLGSEVGTHEVLELRFRQDGQVGGPFGPTIIPSVTIQLSSTSADPFGLQGGLSLVFADNVGADVATVFSGDLVLSSAATGPPPKEFDIVVPLATRFSFDAGSGANLLLDVTVPSCRDTSRIDSQAVMDDAVSRVAVLDATSPVASFRDTLGLVVRLIVLVFEDGFESGDTSGWSATVP